MHITITLIVRIAPSSCTVRGGAGPITSGFVFFPILQGLAEIPTYMLYALPRLEARGVRPWLAVSAASFSLSAQHIFAPFILDGRFILYRLVMFLPFAILIAQVMRWRPRLMPYMAVIHILMDMSVAVMFLMVMQ